MIRHPYIRSAIFKFHIRTGMVLSALILLLTVTGIGLLILRPAQNQNSATDLNLIVSRVNELSKSISESQPDSRIIFILGDPAKGKTISFRTRTDLMQKLAGSRKQIFQLDTGLPAFKESGDPDLWQVIRKNLIELHRSLFLGAKGKFLIGTIAGLYLFVLCSGLLVLSLPFRRFIRSVKKQGVKKAITTSSLHQLVGIILFPWALIVGISGLLLGFSKPINAWYQEKTWEYLAHEAEKSEQTINIRTDPGSMIQASAERNPGYDFWYLAYPGNDYAPEGYFAITLKGSPTTGTHKQKTVFIHSESGQYVEKGTPWYMSFVYRARSFHFGDTGGLPMKIIWGVIAGLSLLIPLSGLKMWRRS